MNWLERRTQIDGELRALSLSLVDDIASVFEETMDVVESCIRSALNGGPVTDIPTRVKLMVASHTFDLLCSSWDDAMVGRFGSATDHWRSIVEGPTFIMAVHINPALGREMLSRTIKIETAVKTVKKGLRAEVEDYRQQVGADRSDFAWVEKVGDELRNIQFVAHVDMRSASAGHVVVRGADSEIRYVNPGGGVLNEEALNLAALYLADASISLAGAIMYAFSDTLAVRRYVDAHGTRLLQQCKDVLTDKAVSMGISLA